MKKICPFLFVAVFAISCNSGSESNTNGDSANTDAPAAIEDTSSQHANGVTNSNVISTDTSKMDVYNMEKKAEDSSKK